ncbi:MAG TPA: hypothetical protein VH308_06975 [Terracidiphilus sp.]|jgi:hypothetical protein|nr:hypothetical protein [Terracidiphilus sp.]
MLKLLQIKSPSGAVPQASVSAGQSAVDALYEQELQANTTALQERRRKNRSRRSIQDWIGYWPLAAGIVVSSFTPQLRHVIEPFRPWGDWLVFPFAALINRPETNLRGDLAYSLPVSFMYLQFPVEGLLAKIGLKGRVTVPRCLGIVLCLHGFAALELFLATGAFGR